MIIFHGDPTTSPSTTPTSKSWKAWPQPPTPRIDAYVYECRYFAPLKHRRNAIL